MTAQPGSAPSSPGSRGSAPPGLTPLVASEPGAFRRGSDSGRQRTRAPKPRVVDAAGAGGVWRAEDPAARHRPPQLVPSVVPLDELAGELMARAADDETRRAARVVVSLPDLRSTVVALAAEAELPDNEPRNGASLQVLVGSITLRTADQQIAVASGQVVAVPAQRHSIRAEEDSALLLTVPLS